MAWRTVFIRSQSFLKVEKSSLAIQADGQTPIKVPLEDIACVILESPQVTLTSALLSQAAERGITVFTCNERHQPNGLLHSFLPHSRQTEVLRRQLSWSGPFKNRVWQAVAQCKIRNQASCLDQLGCGKGDVLRALALRVKSGDSENREARAAAIYFRTLFGRDFRRVRLAGDKPNAALNYGYAVLRGVVARSLGAYGFLPALGIHHDSVQNAFNLADDFIEPFRPFCDRLVASKDWPVGMTSGLTPTDKRELVGLLELDCEIRGKAYGLLQAAEQVASSFAAVTRENVPALLALPGLLPLGGMNHGGRNKTLDATDGPF